MFLRGPQGISSDFNNGPWYWLFFFLFSFFFTHQFCSLETLLKLSAPKSLSQDLPLGVPKLSQTSFNKHLLSDYSMLGSEIKDLEGKIPSSCPKVYNWETNKWMITKNITIYCWRCYVKVARIERCMKTWGRSHLTYTSEVYIAWANGWSGSNTARRTP